MCGSVDHRHRADQAEIQRVLDCSSSKGTLRAKDRRIWAEEEPPKEVSESAPDSGAMLEAPLLLALELVVLYTSGSYAMGRVMRILG
jgi:hypothetical protein